MEKKYRKDYYHANKERIHAKNKAWREANSEKVRELHRQWRIANEGRIYKTRNGYVKYVGFNHPACAANGLTGYHRILLWDMLGGKDTECHWCGKHVSWNSDDWYTRLVTDHVNTVKDDNRPENIVASCNLCNVTREGGQKPKVSKYAGQACAFEICDRPAAIRFKGSKEVYCHAHYNQLYLGMELAPIVEKKRTPFISDTHKHCINCEQTKPWSDFYIRNGKPKGVCKRCEIERITAAKAKRLATAEPCSVKDCNKPMSVKGMCNTHYHRAWYASRGGSE